MSYGEKKNQNFNDEVRQNNASLMKLRLTNTLTGIKEDFVPIRKGLAGMYNCGPTVYHFAHLGNLRAAIFADILRRTLEWNGYQVRQIMNITDVGHLVGDADEGEDKVGSAAKREGKKAEEIAEYYTGAFWHDLSLLNIKTTDTKFPKATQHITDQIALIEELEKKGFTYATSDGVYFDTSKFPAYGALGGIDLTGLQEGARIGKKNEKKNPTDFALWKFFKGKGVREQEWESPWGVGFPGWHIECSAMAMKYLGATFDIHTGGIEHIPVHHNNEIAQAESATGVPYVHYWLHNAHLLQNGSKMSKSDGNVTYTSTLIERGIHPLSFRYFTLGANYRTQLNFTDEAILGAQSAFENILKHVMRLSAHKGRHGEVQAFYTARFTDFINDDLDTPKALALLHELLKDSLDDKDKLATVLEFDKVLGLNLEKLAREMSEIPTEIIELNEERDRTREKRDFEGADKLRKELEEKGYIIQDFAKGSILERTLASLIKK